MWQYLFSSGTRAFYWCVSWHQMNNPSNSSNGRSSSSWCKWYWLILDTSGRPPEFDIFILPCTSLAALKRRPSTDGYYFPYSVRWLSHMYPPFKRRPIMNAWRLTCSGLWMSHLASVGHIPPRTAWKWVESTRTFFLFPCPLECETIATSANPAGRLRMELPTIWTLKRQCTLVVLTLVSTTTPQ